MIEYHADDYGLFIKQSQRILDCCDKGALNGVSIMPNSPNLDECMKLLKGYDDIYITVHLNLVSEKPLSPKNEIKCLVDEKGYFHNPFLKLTLASLFPDQKRIYKDRIKKELTRQLMRCAPYMKNGNYRIDSHRHYHMIPVVFDALMEIIEEKGLKVEYIRDPSENISLIVGNKDIIRAAKPVNLVKVAVLNIFSLRNKCKSKLFREKSCKFTGVYFSGNMNYKNASLIVNKVKNDTRYIKENWEVLFHPGGVEEKEDLITLCDKEDKSFFTSQGRRDEAEALRMFAEK
ncbi:MAG: ChbG/HpnK family deacetylase [Lachnospiraceae bacterium]|nr:ChbG/HpnK family deacetylase [Lachnospiraceae bacterium]